MATGLGKCFAPGTMILMHDGTIKAIEDIREGDTVMGPDSGPRFVTGLAHGFDDMYRIVPVKGDPYTVNSEHILSLKLTNMAHKITGPDGLKYGSRDICNVSVKDFLKATDTFRHCAKGWRAAVDFEEKGVPVPPYILGLWLGDGTARTTCITTMDPEVVRELHRYCVKNGLQLNVVSSETSGKSITYSIVAKSKKHGSNVLRKFLKEYNLFENKHIPQDYMINSRENRLQLLAGLLDTDGYIVDGNVFEIATNLYEMSEQILFLARSLGFAAYRSEKTVNGKLYYRIDISGETNLIPTKVERRIAAIRYQKKDVLVTGITVEHVGRGEYFGFELIGKDRLFLLADFTVVHNTVTFANIPRHGRMLILSHREELVEQPRKYFECSYGIERAQHHSNGEEVVSASVQTMVRRLERYSPGDFDIVIVDEAHHSSARTYRKILDYFTPRLLLGFTATPNRGDHVRLDDVFQKIIFTRDLRWGIQNGYLSDIYCLRCNIGYNLSGVHTQNGDYAPGELDEAMEGTADAIAEAYREYAVGATLIFAVSVRHAQAIAEKIPGTVVVTGETKDRAEIIRRFTDGEIPCIVNCMVFTEGTDIPRVETVIMARPTQSDSLYAQCAGRGLRLYPGKERLTLIDCVGVTGSRSLVTAPSLLGIDLDAVPPAKRKEVQGMLFDLPDLATAAADCPQSWIKNTEIVDLWARDMHYNMHDMNLFRQPDGSMTLSLPNRVKKTIPPPDQLGNVTFSNGMTVPMQTALDTLYRQLCRDYADSQYIWDLKQMQRWKRQPASEAQVKLVQRKCKGYDTTNMTKGEASLILNRVLNR